MEVDDALAKLGTIGRWQVLYYTTISTFCMVPSCVHMLAINYIGKSVILSLETVSSLEIVLTLETVLFCFYLRDALYSAIFAVVQCSSAPLSVRLSGGGVALVFRKNMQSSSIPTPECRTFESLCVRLTSPTGPIVILNVYRPDSEK